MARIATHGTFEVFDGGDYLYEAGDRGVDFFVVLDGAVDILESDGRGGHILITTHEAGQFTGELNHVAGRAVLVCARAQRRTRVVRFTRAGFRNLISAEPEVGEIILRAFVLRRVWLLENVAGSTVIVGAEVSVHAANSKFPHPKWISATVARRRCGSARARSLAGVSYRRELLAGCDSQRRAGAGEAFKSGAG